MKKKDVKQKKDTKVSESVLRKIFKGLFRAVYWIYVAGLLVILGGIIYSLYDSHSASASDFFIWSRRLLFLGTFFTLIVTIVGSIFKLLRKRTVILPVIVSLILVTVPFVAEYVTEDSRGVEGNLVGMTMDYGSYGAAMKSYEAYGSLPGGVVQRQGIVHDSDVFIIAPSDNSKYQHVSENSIKITREEPVSTFSIDVDTASYANVRGYLNRDQLPPKDAIRVEEMINYFPYDYSLPKTKDRPFAIHTTLTESPWKKGNKLLHIGIKGYELDEAEKKPLNLVLLIDTSGSMAWDNRLELLKKGFDMLVNKMTEKDTISIVTYAGSSEVLLKPTSGSEKRKIKSAINSLSANGGTWGEGGLKMAYELAEANFDENAVNRILLGTDGDFNVGDTRDESLTDYISRHSKNGIYLSILNVGRDNVNDALMQKLAQSGNGVGYYLDSVMEAQRVLSDDIQKTLFPIANDVKIQVEFNPEKVAEYRLIGYETRLLNREDFNNDKVDAGEINSGHSVTAIYELTPVGSENQLVDALRYVQKETPKTDKSAETAFVRVRYKLPGEEKSNLIEQPVVEFVPLKSTSDDVRFSIAVSAFGQKLRDSNFVDMTFKDIRMLAKSALGEDEFDYRQDFLSLTKKADALMESKNADLEED